MELLYLRGYSSDLHLLYTIFSLNIGGTLSQFYRYVDSIHMKGTVSQNVDICHSFIYMQKKGKILIIFHDYFSTFHKIKTRTYIKKIETLFPQNECFH